MKLSAKGFYFYVEIGFALVFIAVLLFVVPDKMESKRTVYAYIDLPETYQSMTDKTLSQDDVEFIQLESREQVETELDKNRSSVGLVIHMDNNKVVFDYILQGYEDEKFRNIIQTSILNEFASKIPSYKSITTVTTTKENLEVLPLKINMLPLFLAMNSAFMGLFIIASYIFLDKEEGTIRAFAVTPAKVWHYLLGKIGVMMVSGLITGLLTAICIAGFNVNYLHLIMLLIATNAFGTALGLFISSFFDTMTKAMGWLYMSIVILAFASISYYMPAFSPLIIRILPSYPMLFAFRETFLQAGDIGYIYANVLGFTAAAVIFFLLSNFRFKRTLTV